MNAIIGFYKFLNISLVFILTTLGTLDPECDPGIPGDPDAPPPTDGPCELPLDTWVYILVIAAVIFGAYKLYKKQQAVLANKL